MGLVDVIVGVDARRISVGRCISRCRSRCGRWTSIGNRCGQIQNGLQEPAIITLVASNGDHMRPHHTIDILRIGLNFHDRAVIQFDNEFAIWALPQIGAVGLRCIDARIHRRQFEGKRDGQRIRRRRSRFERQRNQRIGRCIKCSWRIADHRGGGCFDHRRGRCFRRRSRRWNGGRTQSRSGKRGNRSRHNGPQYRRKFQIAAGHQQHKRHNKNQ